MARPNLNRVHQLIKSLPDGDTLRNQATDKQSNQTDPNRSTNPNQHSKPYTNPKSPTLILTVLNCNILFMCTLLTPIKKFFQIYKKKIFLCTTFF